MDDERWRDDGGVLGEKEERIRGSVRYEVL